LTGGRVTKFDDKHGVRGAPAWRRAPRAYDITIANAGRKPKLALVIETTELADVPEWEGIYAFYDRDPRSAACAYVGETTNLRRRLRQHLVLRNSSVATGTSVVGLRVDLIRFVQWWDHDDFDAQDKRLAAELVAFDVLDPTLRSRAGIREGAMELSQRSPFRRQMQALFEGGPAGRLQVEGLTDLAAEIADLRERVTALEELLRAER
jgi:GIY-YIG catalytic domain